MSKYHLSVLIPARNEYYHEIDLLNETVTNVLANTSNRTECVVVLDGYTDSWPKQPLPVNDRLTVIHHRTSIGQRAATNEAARVAQGEYVMKLDAHCALDEKFDEKLLATFEPHWTVVPGQYNLLAFTWKCKRCGTEKDQGPKPVKCGSCNSKYFKQVRIWKPRDGKEGRRTAYTHSWRFDTNLDFQYWGAYTSDERYCKKHGVPFRPEAQGTIHDTMSLLGACWAMRRDRYWEIEPCDEQMGSWGDMGSEISCKTWLSGGELKVNLNTWFAHFFRVGGIGFPYEGGGRKERAKARGRELWLKNQWPKQIYPLSWLIERFRPLPDWHTNDNPTLALVNAAGVVFSPVVSLAGLTSSVPLIGVAGREQMSVDTVGSTGLTSTGTSTSEHVLLVGNKPKVDRVNTSLGVAGMINDKSVPTATSRDRTDGPSVHNAMQQNLGAAVAKAPVASGVSISEPDPALSIRVNSDSGKDGGDLPDGKTRDSEVFLSTHDSASSAELRSGPESRVERDSGPQIITQKQPRKTCLYYTCNSHDPLLEEAARANLRRATNGHEIGCVSLQRTDFGDWTIVLDREKSGATMHHQILKGLERSTADYVFLCESDVFYHPSHFEFTPPRDDTFYYNTNVWRVRWEDGHAVRTEGLQQVSGICANRLLLLNHYRRRVEIIAHNNDRFDVKQRAYEPGTRGKFGDEKVANWQSPYPNLDITGHGQTLTQPHFSIDSFRNPKYAKGWQETDQQIEGWPLIAGRVQEWLREMVDGGTNETT